MPLRSTALLVLLLALSLVMPVATVLAWRRLRGPRGVRVAGRIAMIALSQLVAVALAAVAVNDYAYFFTSWSDLFGSTPAVAAPAQADATRPATHHVHLTLTFHHVGAVVAQTPGTPADYGERVRRGLPAGLTATDWSVRSQWGRNGAVAAFTVTGARTGLTTSGFVYLPAAYFTAPARVQRRLPVVEVFADYSEHPDGLVFQTPYPGYLRTALRAGRTSPMVLVLVRADGPTEPANGCGNRGGADWQSLFSTDLPSALDRTLHLTPRGFATIGIGAGGYCAMRMALAEPDRFVAAASLLGCWAPVTSRDLSREPAVAAGGGSGDDLVALAARRAPAVSALIAPGLARTGVCGEGAAGAFLRDVRAPMSADVVGGYRHARFRWVIWASLMPRVFTWLSRHLPPARGAAA